jgi:Zn finger protein HypA/HybF involved in hydrogenase expression
MAMLNRGVEVPCKRCGKPAPASEMTLDPVYRMMVCRKCVEERRMKDNPLRATSIPAKTPGGTVLRPATMSAAKPSSVSSARPASAPAPSAAKLVASPAKSKIACKKCGWKFNFDAEKNYPQNCPSCGTPVKSGYNFF